MVRLLFFILGLIGFIILTYICIDRHRYNIQEEIGLRVAKHLREENLTEITIQVDGRDVMLSGNVVSEAQKQHAETIVNTIWGVRTTQNHLVTPTSQVSKPEKTSEFKSKPKKPEIVKETTKMTNTNNACQKKLMKIMSEQKILFGAGSARINTFSLSQLDDIAATAKTCPNSRIIVEGHSDTTESTVTNKTLSQKRAQAVANYLKKKGDLTQTIKAIGFGAEKPVTSNETQAGKARNRRIEFKVQSLQE